MGPQRLLAILDNTADAPKGMSFLADSP